MKEIFPDILRAFYITPLTQGQSLCRMSLWNIPKLCRTLIKKKGADGF